MAKPVQTDLSGKLIALSRRVDDLAKHSHPGTVRQPATITGDRSDVEAILGQLLDAFGADGLIIDETT